MPERWSIREVVLHLMDVDLIGSCRIKRIIGTQTAGPKTLASEILRK